MRTTDFDVNQQVLVRQQPTRLLYYWLGHILIYLGFLSLSLTAGFLLYKAGRIYNSYQIINQHVATLQANPAELDLTKARSSLRGIAAEVETLSVDLAPFLPLAPYLGWVPSYGGDLEALPYLVALGRDLAQAGLLLDETLAPLLETGAEAEQIETLPYIVQSLIPVRAQFQEMEERLRQHQVVLDQLNLEELSPPVAHRVSQLKQYLPSVVSGVHVIQSLPTLLGAEVPRTYLVITQNSDELRPSGGYINTAGHVVFDQGRIVQFVMQDSYAVDRLSEEYPYPPDPIHKYMASDYWVLRDAGWSPNFPTAARTVLVLYELGQGISADGVIAFDQQALPFLLRALGPITVEGEQVTSNNVIKLMRQQWAPEVGQNQDEEWWSQRKSFMITMAEIIRQRFEHNFSSINLPLFAEALQEALAEKHILIHLNDPSWSTILAERNWDGSLRPTQGDYLMVVDANLGFNKASAIIERRLSYQIDLAKEGNAQAHVNLFYRHLAQRQDPNCSPKTRYDPLYEQNMERCYWDYVRLVVPKGAELLSGPNVIVEGQHLLRGESTTGAIDVAPVGLDKVSWGQLFLLAPGETISLDYEYLLPTNTARSVKDHQEYHLYLQKQPGTFESSAEVIINLPEGAQLLESKPSPLNQQGGKVTYLLNLNTDQTVDISYSVP